MGGKADAPSEPVGEKPDDDGNLPLPPELLAAIPEDQREELSRRFGQFFLEIKREEHYSGPLPPYNEAARWNEIVPGFAEQSFALYVKQENKKMEALDIVLAAFEKSVPREMDLEEQKHKDSVETTRSVINVVASRERKGQWFAFLAFIFVSLGGFYMVYLGHDAVGVAILVFEAVGVAGVFLHQLRSENDRVSLVHSTRNSSPADPDS